MEDFERFPSGAEFKSSMLQGWLQKLGLRQNIDLQQELTTVASGDEVLIFDVSETGNVKTKKITRANFLAGQINALLDISGASGGQIKFPATQNASSDANTLDDYEEGTWTPTLTFGTPGNLAITYSFQVAYYTKIGRQVITNIRLLTASFTHTTASGASVINGLPFTSLNISNLGNEGTMAFGGITKAGYTNSVVQIFGNAASANPVMSGSGVANATVDAADMPSGGTINIVSTLAYITA